jgi:hypothetical protein
LNDRARTVHEPLTAAEGAHKPRPLVGAKRLASLVSAKCAVSYGFHRDGYQQGFHGFRSAFPRSTSAKLSRHLACDAHAYWVQALSHSAKLRAQFGESAQQTVQ